MTAPIHDIHASNLLTYLALGLALAAVAMAGGGGSFAVCGALLAGAALADTFDGRFARSFARTDRQREIGTQLDSLVDAIVFGLAPIVVVNALPGSRGRLGVTVWWIAAFWYALATVTRLSFYNVEKNESRFVGVPMPPIALIWSTCLIWPVPWGVVPIVFAACAVAMVAPIVIPRPRGAALATFALWGMSLVTVHVGRLLW
jgi:phosphatidylserine synthase